MKLFFLKRSSCELLNESKREAIALARCFNLRFTERIREINQNRVRAEYAGAGSFAFEEISLLDAKSPWQFAIDYYKYSLH